ncbi:D-alanine--D-alanine ligase [Pedobacter alluvionis]|uniref:D-alanine--D-alanine ligase n=1 Tax=Pedobacter alluvionis TaxID=475253 RepID=A0A497XT66_9SPHI|nr:D-alanine--D-alanine ligase [Pedobacter alluvionis]RLJ72588.1 D-alanine-D-alanine ligase [Pedobacter alluvionis]TFB28096.1 D-alanine--D-alanine ligase [Pedobacter alluvionis]
MKKTIALLTGGTTGEWVVSVKSAATIAQNIDSDLYDVYKIMLNEKGWFYEPADSVKIEIDKNDFSLTLEGRKIKFDGVFIAIHGSPGEDGKLQGYFDMLGIPYTACDALTSSITMNKGYTKAVVEGIDNLHTAKSVQIFKGGNYNLNQIKQDLRLPYFVKPNSGGSSIGMTKVKHADDLEMAIEKAFKEDSQILIEEFVSGREFSIGIFGAEGKVVVLPATEVIPKNEFFDFEAKYTPGATEEITPGRMSAEEVSRVQKVVKEVYQKLNCRGVVRIDYFLEEGTGKFYFIEINTIPGQTATSFIPQQVAAMGITLKAFYTLLMKETLG